ncbi:phosphatase PAP2 family protein [Croceibacterium aestuarii]|uniref:phosphatase PAP2 family protein n=1 Tax=Croceibacterium aestuarii TaxID=3064139 RepID=UPI00272E0891|nr:phosphatase PAP2 family protein [Croceibacterium sp. D39]
MTGIIVCGCWLSGGNYDGTGGLNIVLALLAIVSTLGICTRVFEPDSKVAAGVHSAALLFAIGILASLATAVLALDGGAYVDHLLISADRALFPFANWQRIMLWLPSEPELQTLLQLAYTSLTWQPYLYILLALTFGKAKDFDDLLAALSIGLLLCILPFAWLPALGPYSVFGISPADIPGSKVSLPWDYPVMLEALRSGEISRIGIHTLSGLVTFPSFHACGAVVLAWAFWRFRLIRYPMALLNASMLVASVPMGGHYFVDVLAGACCAATAILLSRQLDRHLPRLRFRLMRGRSTWCGTHPTYSMR